MRSTHSRHHRHGPISYREPNTRQQEPRNLPDPDPTPDPAPDPDPDPDPAPERSTVALSGFSALKTPITQRSSPQTPPNAPKRPPRASPRVGGLVSECAGPALTLTRLS